MAVFTGADPEFGKGDALAEKVEDQKKKKVAAIMAVVYQMYIL